MYFMKMAAPNSCFDEWLCQKLQALNTDPEAFGVYIKGILDGDDAVEEKKEALEGILEEFMEEDACSAATEILQEWARIETRLQQEQKKNGKCFDLDQKIASIMEKQAQCVIKERTLNSEEKAKRDALLAQYGQVYDDLSDEDAPCKTAVPTTCAAAAAASVSKNTNDLLVKNVNAELVALNQKEQRERAKADHEKKKEKDKLSREQQ